MSGPRHILGGRVVRSGFVAAFEDVSRCVVVVVAASAAVHAVVAIMADVQSDVAAMA